VHGQQSALRHVGYQVIEKPYCLVLVMESGGVCWEVGPANIGEQSL